MADFPTTPWRDFGHWQKRKKGKWRLESTPVLCVPVADTHAHLEMLSDPAFALARCARNGVAFVCTIVDVVEDADTTFACLDGWLEDAARLLVALEAREGEWPLPDVGTSVSEDEMTRELDLAAVSEEELARAKARLPKVRIAIGCHPHNAKDWDESVEAKLRERCRDPRVAAIGEIGLDYHYDLSPRDDQRRVFREQVRIAQELGMPCALHLREAHDEAFAILAEEGFPEAGTLLHCCSLAPDELACWVEAGCHIAYGGPLTFNNADYCREGAALVPLDRLLTETDSPYMTPVPLRGVECLPDFTVFTAQLLAGIHANEHVSGEEVLARVFDNALELLDGGPVSCQRG